MSLVAVNGEGVFFGIRPCSEMTVGELPGFGFRMISFDRLPCVLGCIVDVVEMDRSVELNIHQDNLPAILVWKLAENRFFTFPIRFSRFCGIFITPNAFAAKIGISQPRISNYLKGREPDFDTLSRICRTFVMIDPRWLLTGEGEMIVKESNAEDSPTGKHTAELIEIIRTQAETLLEQQRFINSGSGKTPPLTKRPSIS